jgi:hypothetical protein
MSWLRKASQTTITEAGGPISTRVGERRRQIARPLAADASFWRHKVKASDGQREPRVVFCSAAIDYAPVDLRAVPAADEARNARAQVRRTKSELTPTWPERPVGKVSKTDH